MSSPAFRTKPDETEGMPPGVPYIIGNEAAERFSFYGMKAILAVYLTKHLVDSTGAPAGLSDEEAKATVAWFTSAVYATPFLGALLADGPWGKYATIMRLSIVYCLGHAVLAMVDVPLGIQPLTVFLAGLGLISLGAGGIKPCVTAHVGDQFGPANRRLLSQVFAWFYFSINVGAFLSQATSEILLDRFGPAVAFGVPGVLMVFATWVFWMGRYRFIHIPPGGKAFVRQALSREGLGALLRVSPLLFFVSIFWSLFDQTAGAWVLQADRLDRTLIDGSVFGMSSDVTLKPSQLLAINPLFVMALIPLFNYGLYPLVERFVRFTPLRKIGAGFVLTGASFALGAVVEGWIEAGETPSLWWQVLMYLLLTAGEVMLSITAYEFYYTQAPSEMKSLVMACYMLSISLGNAITGVVNTVIQRDDGTSMLPGASYYWFFTGLMAATLVGYLLWAPTYREHVYMQGQDAQDA